MAKLPPSQRPERQGPPEILAVGKPYIPGRRNWPDSTADYNWRAGGHELRLFVANISKAELRAVESRRLDFGLLVDLPELYIISRFFDPRNPAKMVISFDCSYTPHLVQPSERTPPPAFEETNPKLRALVTVILVEATSGIVAALRASTYSPEFTRALHRAISEQLAMPFDEAEHRRRVAQKVRDFTTDQL